MLKHYYVSSNRVEDAEVFEYFVGATADIKAVYKSIRRNSLGYAPAFCGFPQFSERKTIYALCIDECGYVTVVNSDTVLSILLDKDFDVQEA